MEADHRVKIPQAICENFGVKPHDVLMYDNQRLAVLTHKSQTKTKSIKWDLPLALFPHADHGWHGGPLMSKSDVGNLHLTLMCQATGLVSQATSFDVLPCLSERNLRLLLQLLLQFGLALATHIHDVTKETRKRVRTHAAQLTQHGLVPPVFLASAYKCQSSFTTNMMERCAIQKENCAFGHTDTAEMGRGLQFSKEQTSGQRRPSYKANQSLKY